MNKLSMLVVAVVILFTASVAEAGGGKGKHRGNGYGPYNQNHTYNHNSDSEDRNFNYNFNGNASDVFNFLGGLLNSGRGSGYYAPPPTYYYRPQPSPIRYVVYYTLYNNGRRMRTGSVGFMMSTYESDDTIADETYRRLGFDEYGVSINNHNVYCQIDQILAR